MIIRSCVCMYVCMQHSDTINQIAVDEDGEYIASCSDDKRVFIMGLFSVRYNNVTHHERPVKVSK